jgi:ketosteroid isomerase-like protein
MAGKDLFAPDVVVIEDGDIPRGGTWYGRAGVWRWIHDEAGQLDGLEDVCFDVEHLVDAGDDVIVLIQMTAIRAATQAPVELDYAQVWSITDGQVTEIAVHLDRAKAFAAARVMNAG